MRTNCCIRPNIRQCFDVCIVHQVMKIHQSTVILLLVICVPLSTYSQNFEAFKKKHLAPKDMSEDKCTTEIKTKAINKDGRCKKINTFIKAEIDDIKKICTTKEEKNFKGIGFDVFDCNKNEGVKECTYTGTFRKGITIILTCKNGFPVHYERSE